jgi:solute carrier family 35 protein F1/2
MSGSKDQVTVQASGLDYDAPRASSSSAHSLPKDAAVAVAQSSSRQESQAEQPADLVDEQKKGFLAYFKTKEFYITVVLG